MIVKSSYKTIDTDEQCRYVYPEGPVCDWPSAVNCTNDTPCDISQVECCSDADCPVSWGSWGGISDSFVILRMG